MKGFQRRLAGLLVFVLLLTAAPLPAAAEDVSQQFSELQGAETAAEETETADEEQEQAEDVLSEEEEQELLGSLEWEPLCDTEEDSIDAREISRKILLAGLKGLGNKVAGSPGSFAVEKIFSLIWPEKEKPDEKLELMKQALGNQEKMKKDLDNLANWLECDQYNKVLNEYNLFVASEQGQINNAFDTLDRLDKKVDEYKAKNATPSDYMPTIEEDRLDAVTSGIGISNMQSAWEGIEQYVDKLYALTTYVYTFTKKEIGQLNTNLLGCHYQALRYNRSYQFEHQAYDTMLAFENTVYANFMQAATIESLSLDARIIRCEQHNQEDPDHPWSTASLITRKATLQRMIEGAKPEDEQHSEVGILPTLEKYEIKLQDTYRYFWYPSSEFKFYTQIEGKTRPKESTISALYDNRDVGWEFEKSDGFKNRKAVDSFWKPFWSSSVNAAAECLSYKDFSTMLEDVNKYRDKDKHPKEYTLYEVLYSEDLAACKKGGSLAMDEKTPVLVQKNDADYPFTVESKQTGYGHNYRFAGYGMDATKTQPTASKFYFCDSYEQYYTTVFFIPVYKYGYIYRRDDENKVYASVVYYGKESETEDRTPVEVDVTEPDADEETASADPCEAKDRSGNPVGRWEEDSRGWWLKTDKGYLASQWAELTWNGKLNWYYFDEQGYMKTGLFTGTDQRTYYLNPVSDGTKGSMLTGWQKIGEFWYYFSTKTEELKEGQSKETQILEGQLLKDTVTPDGYRVDKNGARTE